MKKHPNLEKLSDSAVEKYGNEKYSKLLFKLNPEERNAFVICNLNYQVENGGFLQYFDNGYYCGIPFVKYVLEELDTPESKEAMHLLDSANELWLCTKGLYTKGFELLTEDYFKVNDALIDQVEAYLSKSNQ